MRVRVGGFNSLVSYARMMWVRLPHPLPIFSLGRGLMVQDISKSTGTVKRGSIPRPGVGCSDLIFGGDLGTRGPVSYAGVRKVRFLPPLPILPESLSGREDQPCKLERRNPPP